jgi:hypothetical protein
MIVFCLTIIFLAVLLIALSIGSIAKHADEEAQGWFND